jgi:hypothetical protein
MSVLVVDLSNPGNPLLVGQVDTPHLVASSEALALSGSYAYLAAGRLGLQVVNIADPSHPYLVGSVERPGYAHGVALSGRFAYVASSSGFDHEAALWVAPLACEPPIDVLIDVKPGSHPNSINPGARGVVPVAVLGNATFDVVDIDVTTLRFGPDEAAPAHDLLDSHTYNAHLLDVNADAYLDLVVHFRIPETGIACGDESASLLGETTEGRVFEGSDSLRTVGCRSRLGRGGRHDGTRP